MSVKGLVVGVGDGVGTVRKRLKDCSERSEKFDKAERLKWEE